MGISLMKLNLDNVSRMIFVKNEDGTFSLNLKTKIYSSDDCDDIVPCGDVKISYPRINIKSLNIDVLLNNGEHCNYSCDI